MRKVGLFTIYICNYGAVLQAYALKKSMEDSYKDINVSIVDFSQSLSHTYYIGTKSYQEADEVWNDTRTLSSTLYSQQTRKEVYCRRV